MSDACRSAARVVSVMGVERERRHDHGPRCLVSACQKYRFLSACEIIEDRAVGTMVAVTGVHQIPQCPAYRLELADLFLDPADMLLGHVFDVGARAAFVLIEREDDPAVLDREAETARATDEDQFVRIARTVAPIAVPGPGRHDKTDILVIPDRSRRKPADIRYNLDIHRGDLVLGWTIIIWCFQLVEGQVRQSAATALSNFFAVVIDLPVSGRSISARKEDPQRRWTYANRFAD